MGANGHNSNVQGEQQNSVGVSAEYAGSYGKITASAQFAVNAGYGFGLVGVAGGVYPANGEVQAAASLLGGYISFTFGQKNPNSFPVLTEVTVGFGFIVGLGPHIQGHAGVNSSDEGLAGQAGFSANATAGDAGVYYSTPADQMSPDEITIDHYLKEQLAYAYDPERKTELNPMDRPWYRARLEVLTAYEYGYGDVPVDVEIQGEVGVALLEP